MNKMNLPKALEFEKILERLAEKAVSGPGKEAALTVWPESAFEAAELSMRKTMEAETMLIKRLGYPMRAFSNIEAELRRLKRARPFPAASCCALRGCSARRKRRVRLPSLQKTKTSRSFQSLRAGFIIMEQR